MIRIILSAKSSKVLSIVSGRLNTLAPEVTFLKCTEASVLSPSVESQAIDILKCTSIAYRAGVILGCEQSA